MSTPAMTLPLFAAEHDALHVPAPKPAPPAREQLQYPPDSPDEAATAEALIKWVGGKRELVRKRPSAFRAPREGGRVHIPFVGGGALFFMRFPGQPAKLSDINVRLINAYQATKDDAERVAFEVGTILSTYERQRSAGMEALRQVHEQERERLDVGDRFRRAACFFFVVQWGFNGLYRENSSGECNTPHGDGAWKAFDRARLIACGRALKNAEVVCQDFAEALADARAGDFAYLDCPYAPVSKTASFTSYAAGGSWGQSAGQAGLAGIAKKTDRERLAQVLACLDRRNVDWTLSDADTPETCEMYRGWIIETVEMRRSVNSRGDRRQAVSELLVRNWQSAEEAA